MNKVQLENLLQLYARGKVVPESEWLIGYGSYITKRAIPPYCERIERRDARKYPKRIWSIFEERPRLKSVVAVVNIRAANKAIWDDYLERGFPKGG